MSLFFISAIIDGVDTRFIMDATTKIQVLEQGTLTKHPVQDGSTVSDNYVNGNVQISFSGKVSDIKSINSPLYYRLNKRPVRVNDVEQLVPIIDRLPFVTRSPTPKSASSVEGYIKGLQRVKNAKIPFTIEAGEIGTFDNCFFNSLSISQDSKTGTHLSDHGNLSSVNITFTVSQIRIGSRAETTVIRDDAVKNKFAKQETKAGGKQEVSTKKRIDINNLISFSSLSLF